MCKLKKMDDFDYFQVGKIDILSPNDLVVSNSLCKQIFHRGLYDVLMGGGQEIDDATQEIFDVGSGFHAYILEGEAVFNERYYVADNENALETRVRISKEDYEFIIKSYDSIKAKYPELLDGKSVELAIFNDIGCVKTKSKFDKLSIYDNGDGNGAVRITDLKSTYLNFYKLKKNQFGEHSELKRKLIALDYDQQAYFYKKQIEEWVRSIGKNYTVEFSLMMVSKETFECQEYKIGEDMILNGKSKLDSFWGDIISFVAKGSHHVSRSIEL